MEPMEVIVIYIKSELPKNCLDCKFGRVALQCTAVNRTLGFENDKKRPPWCPLRKLKENEKVGIFKFMGKGKMSPVDKDDILLYGDE